ncbi:unnamed protein product [Leuciscus chuanchicus]
MSRGTLAVAVFSHVVRAPDSHARDTGSRPAQSGITSSSDLLDQVDEGNHSCFAVLLTCISPTVPVFKQVLRLELESDQNVNDPDVRASILQEIQQKLISQGMPEMSNLQWRQQPNGHVFQELKYQSF